MCRPALTLLAFSLALLAAPEAEAFGDCARIGYFASVDARYRGVAVDCVEADRISIRTPQGPREIRIVYDGAQADGIGPAVAAIRQGVTRSEAALMAIGEGTIGPMTVLASPLPPDRPADEDPTEGATQPGDGGCIVVVFPEVTGTDSLAYTFAHEFFHCVQFTLEERAKILGGRNAWWVEGMAEWFAALALPRNHALDGFVADFDAVSPERPLTSMSYEAVVFFLWLSQRFGPSMPMALMHAMPVRGSAAEQQAAVLTLLNEDDLLDFAQAYLDREIERPDGGSLGSNPFPGDIYVWSESRTHEIEAEPFVLARVQLEFACGYWTVGRQAEAGRWRVKKAPGDWMDLPERLEIAGPVPDNYRLAASGVERAGFELSLQVERDSCRGCATLPPATEEARRCLIGSWELVSGGYGQEIQRRLQEQGILETVDYPEFFVEITFAADGSYSTSGTTPHTLTVRDEKGGLYTITGNFAHQSSGFWAIDGEELQLCEMQSHVVIDDEMYGPEGYLGELYETGGLEGGPLLRHRAFTCSGGILVLVEDIPMTPITTWTYSRR